MKQLLVCLILLISYLNSFTQSFVTTNKSWSNLKVDYWNWNNKSTEVFKFTSDTLLNGYVYKVVEISTDHNQLNWFYYGLIREDSTKKVFFRLNGVGNDLMFYDFGAKLNDTIFAHSVGTFNNTSYIYSTLYIVLSIDSLLIGNNYQKQINLRDTFSSGIVYEHWIDSTGNLGGLFHNNDGSVGRDSYSLLCFTEDEIVKYQMQGYSSCYVLTGMEKENSKDLYLKINPNPIDDYFTVTIDPSMSNKHLYLEIVSLFGQHVYSCRILPNQSMSRDNIQPGMYIYTISDSDKTIIKGKIILK